MLRRFVFPLRAVLPVAALLTLAISLAMTAAQGHAETPAAVQVRVIGPAGPVRVGDQFTVNIQIDSATNLGAFEFEFGANPVVAGATAADIHLGTFLGSTGRTTGELRLASSPLTPGRPLYGAYSYGAQPGPSGNGPLASVTMQATGPGVSSLELGYLKVTNVSGEELTATSISGSVQVQAGMRPFYLPLIRRGTL